MRRVSDLTACGFTTAATQSHWWGDIYNSDVKDAYSQPCFLLTYNIANQFSDENTGADVLNKIVLSLYMCEQESFSVRKLMSFQLIIDILCACLLATTPIGSATNFLDVVVA